MTCNEVQLLLNEFVDGDLTIDQQHQMEDHLKGCSRCEREVIAYRSLLAKSAALPKTVAPPIDLWTGIESRLGRQDVIAGNFVQEAGTTKDEPSLTERIPPRNDRRESSQRLKWMKWSFAAAAVLVIGIGSFWLASQSSKPSWQVARLDGTPTIGADPLASAGRLRVGESLETDAISRARLDVGVIGQVEIEPNSRLRLLQAETTDHRLALDRGTIHAKIWAPPRLFFVVTPSATAIDLGCEYTLAVDEKGASVLQVTSGWVALEFAGRESIVPAGAMCVTRAGYGPGTPYLEDATERFRAALERFDFESGGSEELGTVLSEARNMDSITLWHLMMRVGSADRARVYDRLAAVVPPPKSVTRDGVLKGDPGMLEAWQKHLNLGGKRWWQFWF